MKAVICLICVIVYMFLGAFNIRDAIDDFKKQRYGWFGSNIMMALWVTALIFRIIFKYV